jgi:ATP-dependent Clp protease protease subunit
MPQLKNSIEIDWTDVDVAGLTKTVLPEPDLLDFYDRLARREIFWNTQINESLTEIGMYILKWNRDDKDIPIEQRKAIKVFINSNGGCLNSVMNFINIIQLSKTPVYTIAMGKTYSAGCLLLMSGNKRLIFSDTTGLLHDGSTGAYGDTGKVIDNLEFTQKQEERIKKFILKNTKITPKQYDKNYRKDWWLFSEDMIELGIADKIITDLEEIF